MCCMPSIHNTGGHIYIYTRQRLTTLCYYLNASSYYTKRATQFEMIEMVYLYAGQ